MLDLNWFDIFIIFLFGILLLILFFFLLITIIAKIWSLIFINFVNNLDKKGIRLKFIEYLDFDDINDKIIDKNNE